MAAKKIYEILFKMYISTSIILIEWWVEIKIKKYYNQHQLSYVKEVKKVSNDGTHLSLVNLGMYEKILRGKAALIGGKIGCINQSKSTTPLK